MRKAEDGSSEFPLVVITSEMPATGETGVQTHFNDFTAYLKEKGRPVMFVGPDEARAAYTHLWFANGILVRLIPVWMQLAYFALRWLTFYTTRRELKRRLAGLSAWCVYAQDPTTARAALAIRRSPNQRVVLAAHFNRSQAEEMADRGRLQRGGWVYRQVQRRESEVFEAVDKIVVFSKFMHDEIAKIAPGAGKLEVLTNTAATPVSDCTTVRRDLIAIGSLEPRKNQAFLLRTLAETKRRGHIYTLTLVGSGEDSEQLQSLASDLGISDQTFFLGRRPNAAALLWAHKLLVHAALIENLPITLIESLAAGIPILAPPVGGIPEVFEDRVQGRFWYLDDVAASASILISILEDEPLRAKMGVAARERYLSHFSRGQVFGSIAQVIYGERVAV